MEKEQEWRKKYFEKIKAERKLQIEVSELKYKLREKEAIIKIMDKLITVQNWMRNVHG